MSHCITQPSKPISIAGGVAQVHMIPAASDNISWLIEYAPKQVALVDGPSLYPVLDYCEIHRLTITHIINTHTHGDHIGVNHGVERAWKEQEGKEFKPLSFDLEVWGGAKVADAIPHITRPLHEGDRLKLGELEGVAWLTEGHLNGHISLIFWHDFHQSEAQIPANSAEAALFCGDTLFAAGCGRVFDGPMERMYESLQRLGSLPSDTLVFPAHEYTLDNLKFAHYAKPQNEAISKRLEQCTQIRSEGRATLPSNIALELETNPFIRASDLNQFIELRSLKDQGVHRV